MKSKSSSAVAFGSVLQTVRRRSSKKQADVAGSFDPKLSVASVSMAESGDRPPKTVAMVCGYAAALEVDADRLIELWWAMQGMVEVKDRAEKRHQLWWRELRATPEVRNRRDRAQARVESARAPGIPITAPSLSLLALSDAICVILRRLLGNSWEVRCVDEVGLRRLVGAHPKEDELGLRRLVGGRPAEVMIELLAESSEEDDLPGSPELMAAFACPAPEARPVPSEPTERSEAEAMPPDVAWILASVEAMPARERAAVAGFIRGLREGGLYSEVSQLDR